eukprot:403351089
MSQTQHQDYQQQQQQQYSNIEYGIKSQQQQQQSVISSIIGTSPKTKQKYQQLAQQLQVKVEEIEHPPFEIVDNTDDIEPKPANIIIRNEVTTIHNQIIIQSPHQTIDPNKIPLINQQTPQMSNTNNMQQKHSGVNQNIYMNQPQFQTKDPNILTNSTFNTQQLNNQNSFLPKIYQQNTQEAPPTQNGYISDFYKQNNKPQQLSIKKARENNNRGSDKNSNQYVSDQSEKRSQQNNQNSGYNSQGINQNYPINSNNSQQNSGKKMTDKKFFRSKIDFMAPIKSLQNRGSNLDPMLSDDSYYENPPFVGLPVQIQQRRFNKGPPTIKGSDNESQQQNDQQQYQQNHQRANSVSKKSQNQDYHQAIVSKYANLTQIQEETIRSTKSKDNNSNQFPKQQQYPQSLNNSMLTSLQQNQQQIPGSNRTGSNANYGLVSLNRNNLGYRKPSNQQNSGSKNNYQSFIQNTNQIMGMGNGGLKSTTNNQAKKANVSMDQGYNYGQQRNMKMSPLKLPNLKQAYKKETLVTHVGGHHGAGGRLCAVCAKKHNPNQPHIVQSIPQNKKILLQRGPLSLNKSMSRGSTNQMNQNRSQRSLSTNSRNRAGSQSGRQLSLNNSQRSLLSSRNRQPQQQNNYNQIDRLRSVNKLRTIPRQPNVSDFSRNYKSLSPRVSMISRGKISNNQQLKPGIQNTNTLQYQRPINQQQTYAQYPNNINTNPRASPGNYKAMVLTPKKTIGKASFGLPQNQHQNQESNNKQIPSAQLDEPELVCREKELDPSIEDEIKDGFFELRQKFKDEGGESSIYVSHVVLHAKHPIFCKLEIDTLKNLLTDSSIIYLAQDQVLYKSGSQDTLVYFVLFGRLNLLVPPVKGLNDEIQSRDDYQNNQISGAQSDNTQGLSTQVSLGKANIGWTVGEEVLFDKNMQIRQESCIALVESCLLGIQKSKLAIIQKALLDKGNQKDYFVIESVLKGNFLIKNNWRKDMQEYYSNSIKSRSTPGQSQLGQDDMQNIHNNNRDQQTFLT